MIFVYFVIISFVPIVANAEGEGDSDKDDVSERSGYVPEGYSPPAVVANPPVVAAPPVIAATKVVAVAPVAKKVIPVKKIVEYVRPQPVISYAPPVPVKSVEPILVETKHIGNGGAYGPYGTYGPYGAYGARRDILPAPVIPLGKEKLQNLHSYSTKYLKFYTGSF